MTPPSAKPVLDLIEAFRASKAMFVAVRLGLFDRLANGPADASTLAEALNLDATERLLDTCVALGFLEQDAGLYRNTAVANAYLRRDSPRSLCGYILYSDQVLFPMWANLETALREGTSRWEQTFGFQGDLFAHFYQTPEARRDFLLGMHGVGRLSSPAVVAAFDLGSFHRMVDLGGATGHLGTAALDRYPHLEAAVFDLPAAIEFARANISDHRLEWIAGDFFADPLPPADLYAASRILHDWPEAKIVQLLRKVHASLPTGGALLLAEKLLHDDKRGPLSAHLQSLNMLICTEGRERSLAEYRQLLENCGFLEVEGRRTGTPLDAILARKT